MNKNYTNTGITDLMRLKYPVTAITSIMHRISGVIAFVYIPLVIYALSMSLSGEHGYIKAIEYSKSFIVYPLLLSIFFHLLAGIRHLIMDIGFFESKTSGKITALAVIFSAILSVFGYAYENF